jgi:hypothetical protein
MVKVPAKEHPITLPPITKRARDEGLLIDTSSTFNNQFAANSPYASSALTYNTSLSPTTFLDQAFYPPSAEAGSAGGMGLGGLGSHHSLSTTPNDGYNGGYDGVGGYFGYHMGIRPYAGLGIWPSDGVPLVFDPNVVLPPVTTRPEDGGSWDCGGLYQSY